MKPRQASAFFAVLAALGACKHSEDKPAPVAAPQAAPAQPQPDPWTKQEAKKEPLPHPLFWAVEKDGKTTYFFGTMHMGVDPNTHVPDLVWQKLDQSPAFAMETDL